MGRCRGLKLQLVSHSKPLVSSPGSVSFPDTITTAFIAKYNKCVGFLTDTYNNGRDIRSMGQEFSFFHVKCLISGIKRMIYKVVMQSESVLFPLLDVYIYILATYFVPVNKMTYNLKEKSVPLPLLSTLHYKWPRNAIIKTTAPFGVPLSLYRPCTAAFLSAVIRVEERNWKSFCSHNLHRCN